MSAGFAIALETTGLVADSPSATPVIAQKYTLSGDPGATHQASKTEPASMPANKEVMVDIITLP